MMNLENKIDEVLKKQQEVKSKVRESVVSIRKNEMTKYMQLEKMIMFNIHGLKDLEKELIEEIKGEKITEIIKRTEITEDEKQILNEKVKNMVVNYREINDLLLQARMLIEPKVEMGEIILQTVNEEVGKINQDGGNLLNKKI